MVLDLGSRKDTSGDGGRLGSNLETPFIEILRVRCLKKRRYFVLVVGVECHAFFDCANATGRRLLLAKLGLMVLCK